MMPGLMQGCIEGEIRMVVSFGLKDARIDFVQLCSYHACNGLDHFAFLELGNQRTATTYRNQA